MNVESGVADILRQYSARHLPPKPVSRRRLAFERQRPRILRECTAEAIGVFFFVFCGGAAIGSLVSNSHNPVGAAAYGSMLQVGISYCFGIVFGLVLAAPISGGHLNPAMTICFAVWSGFPWRKVPHYIFSQIIGATIACFLIAGMYHQQIQQLRASDLAAGRPDVSATGPASILVTIPGPEQTNLGWLFLIEFFVDTCLNIVTWAAVDPGNPFVSRQTTPFIIGGVYGAMIWGFADISIGANPVRDLGGRIAAASIFGRSAFTIHEYAWIPCLTSFPAALFATGIYELLLRDSLDRIGAGQASFESDHHELHRILTAQGGPGQAKKKNEGSNSVNDDEDAYVEYV